MSSKRTTWVVCWVVDLSVLFSALFWEMIQFDYMCFSDGLKPPTSLDGGEFLHSSPYFWKFVAGER